MVALTFARRYDEAVQQLERVAQRYPKRALGDFWLVGGAAPQGKDAEDFDRLTRFEKLAESDEASTKAFKNAYQTEGWQGVLREQTRRSPNFNPTFYVSACVYAQAGEKEKALEYLEKTYQHREHWMTYLEVDPRFDKPRDDPRFEALVKRVEAK